MVTGQYMIMHNSKTLTLNHQLLMAKSNDKHLNRDVETLPITSTTDPRARLNSCLIIISATYLIAMATLASYPSL